MRFVYDILFFLFSVIYLPSFFIKGKHKDGFISRFGVVPDAVKEKLSGKNVIWIHAVSVGEMAQAVRLADALRNKYDNVQFVLTATTTTGKEIAEKFKKPEDMILYFPVDFRTSVGAFIRGINPRAVIILETEIWPNLLCALSERRIPVFIMNGRLSDRAISKYRLMKFFLAPLLNRLTWVGAQDERMKSRFLELGLESRRITVTGNMKFDWEPPVFQGDEIETIEKRFKTPGSFLCIAGSTHAGEEAIFFDLVRTLSGEFPFFKLLIAPRHLDRIESIESQARQKGIRLEKFSNGVTTSAHGAVLLLDKMGILAHLYRLADVVFVGGSLVPYGGHNLIEPAYFEKPVLFGPWMNNFKEMAFEFKKAEAAVEVKDPRSLEAEIRRFIKDQQYRKTIGLAAKKLIERHRGATEKNTSVFVDTVHF